jgi:hypothetical protein
MSGAGINFQPGKLWSLLDMLQPYAHRYFVLGFNSQVARVTYVFLDEVKSTDSEEEKAEKEKRRAEAFARIGETLAELKASCLDLDLPVSLEIIEEKIKAPPATMEAFQMLLTALKAEIKSKQFLFVPSHLAKYHDLILQSFITTAFPLASKEIVNAGNCLAAGLYTACVFHSMRAAEIGVRVLGNTLGVTFPDKPIELAEWQNILDQAESKIKEMKDLKPRQHKDEELKFWSQAATQFIYFKDAWRVRVAHARETYEETPATRVFSHTLELFEVLATRLSEPSPAV